MKGKSYGEVRDHIRTPYTYGGNTGMTEENSESDTLVCHKCGKKTVKLFQNNTCKSCLVSSFSKVKQVIDIYRAGYGESVSGKSGSSN